MPGLLKDKVFFITGSSRGIGREIALKFASEGAGIVVAAKSDTPHPTLPGTIHTVAKEIEAIGGVALPIPLDVRDDVAIEQAVEKAISHYGRLDGLVNNASAIKLAGTLETEMKRFDLMFSVNVRGTFACSRACIPHLMEAPNPHIINISPPLTMTPKWFQNHLAYTMSKYGMSMCVMGMAAEFQDKGIAVNALWPKTTIATKAVEVNFPKEIYRRSRKPVIMADAALALVLENANAITGEFIIDEDFLREKKGITDFSHYQIDPSLHPFRDYFLED